MMTFKTLLFIRKNFKRQVIDKNLELDRVLKAIDRIEEEEGTCWPDDFSDVGNKTTVYALKMERDQLRKVIEQLEDAISEIESAELK